LCLFNRSLSTALLCLPSSFFFLKLSTSIIPSSLYLRSFVIIHQIILFIFHLQLSSSAFFFQA
jgi:hypothetical protein